MLASVASLSLCSISSLSLLCSSIQSFAILNSQSEFSTSQTWNNLSCSIGQKAPDGDRSVKPLKVSLFNAHSLVHPVLNVRIIIKKPTKIFSLLKVAYTDPQFSGIALGTLFNRCLILDTERLNQIYAPFTIYNVHCGSYCGADALIAWHASKQILGGRLARLPCQGKFSRYTHNGGKQPTCWGTPQS